MREEVIEILGEVCSQMIKGIIRYMKKSSLDEMNVHADIICYTNSIGSDIKLIETYKIRIASHNGKEWLEVCFDDGRENYQGIYENDLIYDPFMAIKAIYWEIFK